MGFVSGPRPLVERIVYHMQASVLHTSQMSQVGFEFNHFYIGPNWKIDRKLSVDIRVSSFLGIFRSFDIK